VKAVIMPAGTILCYHSLTTPELPSAGVVNLPLESFQRDLAVVERWGRIVPLVDLLERHAAGRSTRGLVAITFDDAYASLLLLKGQSSSGGQVPLTVFVTVDASREGRRFWWDRIDDLHPRVPPERWRAFEDSLGLPESYRAGQPPEFGPLRPLRQFLLAAHLGRWPVELEPQLAALEAEAGFVTRHRAMTLPELDTMAQLPGVTFGVHTMSHPVLPLLNADEMRREILDCHAFLQSRFPAVVPVLAIPFGLFDARVLRVAREAGMSASLTLANRTIRRTVVPGGVPRFGLTSREPGWKLWLKLMGIGDHVADWRDRGRSPYPELPSATS
jgi:peptidoglycan/xylan/chitin deacetylase (PgdA/CDA1 family)